MEDCSVGANPAASAAPAASVAPAATDALWEAVRSSYWPEQDDKAQQLCHVRADAVAHGLSEDALCNALRAADEAQTKSDGKLRALGTSLAVLYHGKTLHYMLHHFGSSEDTSKLSFGTLLAVWPALVSGVVLAAI